MNIKFSTIRYWHLQDGNVNILFDSTEETKLFFNGGNFCMSGDVHNACYSTYNIKSHEKTHVINNIKETEDFDFILQIDDTIYTANTDFRVAIKCNEIAQDDSINDYERPLAIICTMFGEKGLDNPSHYEKIFHWILQYLSCGKEIKKTNDKPDMDYVQDMEYIEASFMSDYRIDLTEIEMDWQKFNKLIIYLKK